MKPEQTVARILAAAGEYRIADCEQSLEAACADLPTDALVNDVLAPLLREAGNRWHTGEFSIVQEHLLSSAVRRQLFYALDRHGRAAHGPTIAFTTLSGERHELGSLMLAVAAASRGFRAVYLGADLPVEEIARFCARVDVAAVAISIVTTPEVIDAYAQLAALRALLSPVVEIWIGGQAANLLDADGLPAGSFRMRTMSQFNDRLAALGKGGPGS